MKETEVEDKKVKWIENTTLLVIGFSFLMFIVIIFIDPDKNHKYAITTNDFGWIHTDSYKEENNSISFTSGGTEYKFHGNYQIKTYKNK